MEALVAPLDTLQPAANASGLKKHAATKAEMARAAKEFEAVFMAQMLKPMWEGVETNGMFGGGHGEDVMRDMLVQEYGKSMVQGTDYGLSTAIMDTMIRMQEHQGGTQG
ncbi:MAG TPA: hypothetical protein DCY07_08060 [Rhodospirillaceae bacterium]|nr:hypothetical protein [Rhodospirillaceae bacterium]